jgi:fructose-bisphosphate aldolase class II
MFTVAAFGIHGVYKPGNVELRPAILKNSQDYIERGIENRSAGLFCISWWQWFAKYQIREAIGYGAIKMNIIPTCNGLSGMAY